MNVDWVERFDRFIQMFNDGAYQRQLEAMVTQGTGLRLEVSYLDLYSELEDLAVELLHDTGYLPRMSQVIQDRAKLLCAGNPEDYQCGLVNLPDSETRRMRGINFNDIGRLVQVKGTVLRVGVPEQVPVETTFICDTEGCTEEVTRSQTRRWIIKPEECDKCGGRRWSLDPRRSVYRERQIVKLYESWDDVGGSDSPRSTPIFLWDDLVNRVKPGDRVRIVGVPDVRESEKSDPEMSMELYVTANSVTQSNRETEETQFTPEETAKFSEEVSQEGFMDRLAGCISPTIYGNETVKKAILLQLVGGVPKSVGGDKKRGEIHIMLTGDAGTGKTTLIRAAAGLSPRGVFTTGTGSSKAGLTAAIVKDKDGQMGLDAGAMVLGNGGLMAVDEFDKMGADDRGAMHTAMESGVVAINKAGINAILNAKTSVLAACNPKMGRYNTSETLLKNLSDFPETLLSRFDGIFIFIDEGNKKLDEEKARHVDRSMREPETLSTQYDDRWMRRFITYAKTLKPRIPVEVGERIIRYYVDMRHAGRQSGNCVSITQRQQEALYRFTEASAKINLRAEATLADAENAIQVISYGLMQVGVDPDTGKMDIDALYTGIPKSMGEKIRLLPGVVREMEAEGQECYAEALIDYICQKWGIKHPEAEKIVNTGVSSGILFRPRVGVIKVS